LRGGSTACNAKTIRVPQITAPAPAVLIERRPDIQAAEARLGAAGGDVDAARRAFYPSFGLSVGAVARSEAIGIFNPLVTIGADLLPPIFAHSRLRGELALSAAAQREAVGLYRQSVLTALRDVEDALSAIDHARQREALLTDVEAEARTTSGLARRQYLEGDTDLQQLLDAQDLLIAAQDARALARQELLAATVALYALTAPG
jgi:multidrug efflux system outer membrane protein